MNLARIDGTIVSSACHPSMRGTRTVICQPLKADGTDDGDPILATDTLGAGLHQHVLVTTDGSETRKIVRDEHSPLRNHILGIVDDSRGVACDARERAQNSLAKTSPNNGTTPPRASQATPLL